MKKLIILITVFTVVMMLPSFAQVSTGTSTKQNAAFTGTLPAATLAGLTGGDITYSTISTTDTISTKNSSFKVVSFTLSSMISGSPVNYTSSSNQIETRMKDAMKKLVVGNVVTFKDIKAKYKPTGSIYTLSSLVFNIK
jgi:hypothetical protein